MEKRTRNANGTHLWLVLMKAYQSLNRHALRSIAATGLCYSDFAVLEILLHKSSLPVNVLGSKVDLTSGSATAAIDRLEKKKLVYRANDPGDRRARIVHLTPKGKVLIEKVFRDHSADMESATLGLNPKETAAAIVLLKKLGKHATASFANSGQGVNHHEVVANKS